MRHAKAESRGQSRCLLFITVLALATACVQEAPDESAFASTADAGPGADVGAGFDASLDAVSDAGPDRGVGEDAGKDTGKDAGGTGDPDVGGCLNAFDCDSGDPCVQDACNDGDCLHVPKDAYADCGKGKQCVPNLGCTATVRGSSAGLALGASSSCALLDDGTLWCWGKNNHGQLGLGSKDGGTVGESWPVPATAAAKSAVPASSVEVGNNAACAVDKNNKVHCWGDNTWGQLGAGDGFSAKSSLVPVAVDTTATFSSVALAITHGCGLRLDGKVMCWGLGNSGQLGDDKGVASKVPVLVTGLPVAESVVVGEAFSCARTTDLNAFCWGTNGQGQLGDGKGGTSQWSNKPVQVTDLGVVTAVAAGKGHACARTSKGEVACWGANSAGQLGQGTASMPKPEPHLVTLPFEADAIAAKDDSTCAYQLGGQLACWGANDGGQLGVTTNSKSFSATPLLIAGFIGLEEVALGDRHACAIVNDGHVLCWGDHYHGQLGLGPNQKGSTVPKLIGQPAP